MMNIGVIGKGFVGGAICASYDGVTFYDPFKKGSVANIRDLMECRAIFVCVPTPMGENGKCDDSIVVETLQILVAEKYAGLVIAKSTAPFETYEQFAKKLQLVFVPEFLRAASATEDYLKTEFMIVGADDQPSYLAALDIIGSSKLNMLNTFKRISIREACLVKYFENSFLATKVSLMNEFHILCGALETDWYKVIDALTLDQRIGADHTQVPGPDGNYGWGGHCFPKDTMALLSLAAANGITLPTLASAVMSNMKIRNANGGIDV